MKKIYMLMVIAILGITGWSATINATENIIDLGTIEYSNIGEQTLIVKINSTECIELTYISSDTNETWLHIFSYFFLPSENVTRYVFATRQVESVDWWFINDTKQFIYQDNSTDQLYSVNVDYSAIQVPPDPLIEWMEKHNILVNSYDELEILLNATLKELNATRNELQEKWDTFNQSQDKFDNNTIEMAEMQKELDNSEANYTEIHALWISATTNASTYESNWRTLGGENDDLQKDYDNLSGIWPIWMFFAVLGTGIIMFFILKGKKMFEKKQKTDTEIERDTGSGTIAKMANSFKIIGGKFIPKQRRNEKDDVTPEPKPAETEVDIQNIHEKIDGIKSAHDEFQKTIVKDFQGIETRVDNIETKLEIKK